MICPASGMPSKKVRARERKAAAKATAAGRHMSPSARADTLPTVSNASAAALIAGEGTETDAMFATQFMDESPEYQPTAVQAGGAVALLRSMPGKVPFVHARSRRLIMYIFTRPECRRRGDARRLVCMLQRRFGALVAVSSNTESEGLLLGCDFKCVDDVTDMYVWEQSSQ